MAVLVPKRKIWSIHVQPNLFGHPVTVSLRLSEYSNEGVPVYLLSFEADTPDIFQFPDKQINALWRIPATVRIGWKLTEPLFESEARDLAPQDIEMFEEGILSNIQSWNPGVREELRKWVLDTYPTWTQEADERLFLALFSGSPKTSSMKLSEEEMDLPAEAKRLVTAAKDSLPEILPGVDAKWNYKQEPNEGWYGWLLHFRSDGRSYTVVSVILDLEGDGCEDKAQLAYTQDPQLLQRVFGMNEDEWIGELTTREWGLRGMEPDDYWSSMTFQWPKGSWWDDPRSKTSAKTSARAVSTFQVVNSGAVYNPEEKVNFLIHCPDDPEDIFQAITDHFPQDQITGTQPRVIPLDPDEGEDCEYIWSPRIFLPALKTRATVFLKIYKLENEDLMNLSDEELIRRTDQSQRFKSSSSKVAYPITSPSGFITHRMETINIPKNGIKEIILMGRELLSLCENQGILIHEPEDLGMNPLGGASAWTFMCELTLQDQRTVIGALWVMFLQEEHAGEPYQIIFRFTKTRNLKSKPELLEVLEDELIVHRFIPDAGLEYSIGSGDQDPDALVKVVEVMR